MEQILLSISFALITGLVTTRLAKKVNLPAVTAYLVTGLIVGPFCIGALNISGIGFNTLEQVDSFNIISQVALGFIAFSIGNEFRLHDLKSMGRQAITVGILQAVITTIVVDIALIVLHVISPSTISISSAITLGAIAAATAPAATLMVVRQYKAEGPLTKLLLMVVAIDDAVGLIVFAISYGIATAIEQGTISMTSIVVEPVLEIVCSIVLGVIAGYILTFLEKGFHSRSKRMSLAVSFVLLTTGISMQEFEIGGVTIGFSLLLVCMITGTIFCNLSDASEELMQRVDSWTAPLNILFFVLSGAELNLNVLVHPTVLLVGIIFVAARTCGKMTGARFSCELTSFKDTVCKYLGPTLLPQAGVALGMALTAANLSDGAIISNVVLFSVLIYELVGPTVTKIALTKAGEINPDGKTNARVSNPERSGMIIHDEEKRQAKLAVKNAK